MCSEKVSYIRPASYHDQLSAKIREAASLCQNIFQQLVRSMS